MREHVTLWSRLSLAELIRRIIPELGSHPALLKCIWWSIINDIYWTSTLLWQFFPVTYHFIPLLQWAIKSHAGQFSLYCKQVRSLSTDQKCVSEKFYFEKSTNPKMYRWYINRQFWNRIIKDCDKTGRRKTTLLKDSIRYDTPVGFSSNSLVVCLIPSTRL